MRPRIFNCTYAALSSAVQERLAGVGEVHRYRPTARAQTLEQLRPAHALLGNFDAGYTLYRNAGLAGADNHWLTVRLEGRAPVNRDAIGARVFVTAGDGRPRMQEVKSGSSLGAGNDTALHFGLGGSATADVRVRWPDGTEALFVELAADQVWGVIYGQPEPRR